MTAEEKQKIIEDFFDSLPFGFESVVLLFTPGDKKALAGSTFDDAKTKEAVAVFLKSFLTKN